MIANAHQQRATAHNHDMTPAMKAYAKECREHDKTRRLAATVCVAAGLGWFFFLLLLVAAIAEVW